MGELDGMALEPQDFSKECGAVHGVSGGSGEAKVGAAQRAGVRLEGDLVPDEVEGGFRCGEALGKFFQGLIRLRFLRILREVLFSDGSDFFIREIDGLSRGAFGRDGEGVLGKGG